MKFKKMLIITLLLLAVFTISSVSATDNLTDEGVLQDTSSDEIELSDDVNEDIVSSSEDEIISAKDDGTFTALQNKINNAEAGATITLENDYAYDEGFDTNGIHIQQKSDLTIDGGGHILNGLSKSRIMILGTVYNITIKNVKFKNGYSVDNDYDNYEGVYTNGNGGAIYFSTTLNARTNLNLLNCEFENNVGNDGGAIYGKHGTTNSYPGYESKLTCLINNCIFKNNFANGEGGAICDLSYSDKNWNIISCNFNNNKAQGGGGAICSQINYLQVENCKFNDNAGISQMGGAIVISQNYVNKEYVGGAHTNVSNCEFNKNQHTAILWVGDYGNLNSCIFKYNTNDYDDYKDVVWNGKNGVISNCKSYTTGNKEKNLDVNSKTTMVKGFDIYVVDPNSQSSSGSSSSTSKTTKATPKLIVKKATFKVKQKTKKYTATLKTNKNKAMKKITLYLKVKGKTYTAKTNSNGKAIFKIKNLKKKGTYKATVTFKGNSNYNKVTKTVKIKVK